MPSTPKSKPVRRDTRVLVGAGAVAGVAQPAAPSTVDEQRRALQMSMDTRQ